MTSTYFLKFISHHSSKGKLCFSKSFMHCFSMCIINRAEINEPSNHYCHSLLESCALLWTASKNFQSIALPWFAPFLRQYLVCSRERTHSGCKLCLFSCLAMWTWPSFTSSLTTFFNWNIMIIMIFTSLYCCET